MIKVIRDGYEAKPTIRIYTVECPVCHCLFECNYHDFTWQARSIVFEAGINCPHCGREIKLDNDTPCRVEFLEEEK